MMLRADPLPPDAPNVNVEVVAEVAVAEPAVVAVEAPRNANAVRAHARAPRILTRSIRENPTITVLPC